MGRAGEKRNHFKKEGGERPRFRLLIAGQRWRIGEKSEEGKEG